MWAYMFIYREVNVFGLWFENILETWNSQILIIYVAPGKETIYSAGAI